ncbi:MAG TPA: chemotaxis protein CheW [Polyangiaceae bacterium]|jgi:purine-binding chemotaxis protein CheW|nr:chemotaxis protein CheW [Polyangiaceae bacterium]
MTQSKQLEDRLQKLRNEFDRSFAIAVDDARVDYVDFLAIRLAGDSYVLRLSEVSSLHIDRRLTPAPSELSELRGIAGFRGVLTPVYDLGALLGYAATPMARWLCVARASAPIAFLFESFESHLRLAPERISSGNGSKHAIGGTVQTDSAAIPLLDLPLLIAGIAARIKASGPSQER